MTELPLATGFYEDSTKPVSAQECANWIPHVPETNAQSKVQLKPTPGLSAFADTGIKNCRGAHVMDGIAYSVNGSNFYRINSDGTVTNLGTIVGQGRVSMADNGTQICIVVPGSTGYIYTVAGGLQTITDADFTTTLGPSQQVTYKDGYFIHFNNTASVSTGKIFFISNLNDGLVYDPLDFGTAEADPDKITAIHVNRNILYVGGNETIEPFQNIGGADFPFQRIPGGLIQKGISAKFSPIDTDNTFYFVGAGLNEGPAIWRFAGNTAQKLSSASIDQILQQLTQDQVENIYATTYAEEGGYFVNFHLADQVFSYDAAASSAMQKPVWHERKSKDQFDNLVIWRVTHIIAAYGRLLVGDNQSGTIGEMKRTIHTEYGKSINRAVASMPFHNEGERVKVPKMELVCETGTAPANYTPRVVRFFSDDGGYTFGNGIARSLGVQGQRKIRQIWRQGGQFDTTRVYKFVIDEPIKATIIKFRADFS